jgi:hypothetical protein
MADQVDRRLQPPRQIRRRAVAVDVQVEHVRLVPEEMVVQRGHVEAVFEQRAHHRVDLVLQQHEIAHQHLHPAGALRHCDPAAEAERRRRLDPGNRHLNVIARDVHLQHLILEVALLPEHRQHLLIFGGHLLRERERRRERDQRRGERRRVLPLHTASMPTVIMRVRARLSSRRADEAVC